MNPIIFILIFTFTEPTTPPVSIAMFYDDTPAVLEEQCNNFIIELKNDMEKRAKKMLKQFAERGVEIPESVKKLAENQGKLKCIPQTMIPGQNPNYQQDKRN